MCAKWYNQILCGLAQIKNNFNITVLKTPEIIFDSLSKEEPKFHNIILNNNEAVLGCRIGTNNIKMKKITINNNIIIKNDINSITIDCKKINHFQMLKDNYSTLMLVVNYNTTSNKIQNEFYYFGYSTCQDITQTIYNGEKTKLYFNVMLPIMNFKLYLDDIVLYLIIRN